MDFMERDLDTLFDENFAYEPKKPQEGKNFPYVMLSKLDGRHEEVPLTSIGMVTDYVQKTTGQLFHINENIIGKGSGARLEDLKDPPKEIAAYLKRAMTEVRAPPRQRGQAGCPGHHRSGHRPARRGLHGNHPLRLGRRRRGGVPTPPRRGAARGREKKPLTWSGLQVV